MEFIQTNYKTKSQIALELGISSETLRKKCKGQEFFKGKQLRSPSQVLAIIQFVKYS